MLGGGELTARSAVGIDARGDLLYAGSMSALPSDMARALVQAGAVTAMQFDINPEWVQADTATSPGGPLSAAVPGQNRPADQYLTGWTRDYVTVLAGLRRQIPATCGYRWDFRSPPGLSLIHI